MKHPQTSNSLPSTPRIAARNVFADRAEQPCPSTVALPVVVSCPRPTPLTTHSTSCWTRPQPEAMQLEATASEDFGFLKQG